MCRSWPCTGKHVYCEKPLTHNISEAREVARVARETGVATQLGNHGHSHDTIRQTCEWIWDGVIGPVREVQIWVGAGRFNPSLTGKPTDSAAPPCRLQLGPMARSAGVPAFPSGIRAGNVARLLGLRLGVAG